MIVLVVTARGGRDGHRSGCVAVVVVVAVVLGDAARLNVRAVCALHPAQEVSVLLSRNHELAGDLSAALHRAEMAVADAKDAKQELMRQVRGVAIDTPSFTLVSPIGSLCRRVLQGSVWEQRETSLVDQLALAEKATQRKDALEAELAALKADLRMREQVQRCPPCRVVSCRAVSCRAVSCRVVSCRVVSCRVVSCRVVSCRVVSCRVVSCRVVSCRVVLRRVAPRRVVT